MITSNSNQRHQHHHHWVAIALSLLLSTILFVILRSTASAATINVVAGTDAINDNDQCQLSEAIENINDQAQTNDDCPAGDGNNDTINLPAGTITLTTNLPELVQSVTIQGQGMGETIINGDGQYVGIGIEDVSSEAIEIKGIKFIEFYDYAIGSQQSNTIVEDIEIDGSAAVASPNSFNGIFVAGGNVQVSSVYIHDISGNPNGGVTAILLASVQGIPVDVQIDQLTVKNISSNSRRVGGVVASAGLIDGSLTPGTITASITNSTFTNIASDTQNASAVIGIGAVNGGSTVITLNLTNNTFTNIDGANGDFGESANLGTLSAALSPGDETNISIESRNTILNSTNDSCRKIGDVAQSLGSPTPSAGTITENITSLGGNISDDTSCNDYFTQESDQNNITNLADFIGDIADNGGSVPTMALLPGNPAIDGGVCGEGVPSTDARGITRPQGTTCDSGAFEVEQAASTGTVAGDTAVALNVPTGVVVNEFSTVSGSIPADNQGDAEYEFPLGLLSFELGVVEGSANEISLDFESDLDPESVVARKYNPSDQTYTTLENAVVTKITKDNQPTLRLTYTITDGTFPDLDNQANGTIIDPIGLATEKKGVLANTGDLIILAIPIGLSLLLGAFIVTYIDYRKHKKPLQEADQELAKTYTYWHHLKTVTIPLFSYRLSFGFERRESVQNSVT